MTKKFDTSRLEDLKRQVDEATQPAALVQVVEKPVTVYRDRPVRVYRDPPNYAPLSWLGVSLLVVGLGFGVVKGCSSRSVHKADARYSHYQSEFVLVKRQVGNGDFKGADQQLESLISRVKSDGDSRMPSFLEELVAYDSSSIDPEASKIYAAEQVVEKKKSDEERKAQQEAEGIIFNSSYSIGKDGNSIIRSYNSKDYVVYVNREIEDLPIERIALSPDRRWMLISLKYDYEKNKEIRMGNDKDYHGKIPIYLLDTYSLDVRETTRSDWFTFYHHTPSWIDNTTFTHSSEYLDHFQQHCVLRVTIDEKGSFKSMQEIK